MDPLLHPPFPSCAVVPMTSSVSAPFAASATFHALETARADILRDGGRVTALQFTSSHDVLRRPDVATTLSLYEALRGGAPVASASNSKSPQPHPPPPPPPPP